MKKIILDLCGGTGAWAKPWKDAGYDVITITLPKYDVTQHKFVTPDEEMYLYFLDEKDKSKYLKIKCKDIYGILAAPPCTMFSIARTTAKVPRDMRQGMETVEACMRIIWGVQYEHQLKFWALENPKGLLRRFLGIPSYTFEQWWFDKDAPRPKPTDIWGKFELPKRTVNDRPAFIRTKKGNIGNWQKPIPPKGYEHIKDRAALRAITPEGFARAFYKANK